MTFYSFATAKQAAKPEQYIVPSNEAPLRWTLVTLPKPVQQKGNTAEAKAP